MNAFSRRGDEKKIKVKIAELNEKHSLRIDLVLTYYWLYTKFPQTLALYE